MRKNTIFLKLFTLFVLFTFLIIGTLWILQANFLEQYYLRQKIGSMREYGQQIQSQLEIEGNFSQQTAGYIKEISHKINGRIIIFDRGENIIYYEGTMGFHRANRIPRELLSQVLRGKSIQYKVPGPMGTVDFLAVAVPLESNIYLFQTPIGPIEEAIQITQQFNIYLLAIGFIIALILSGIFSTTITKPIVKLNRVAQEMTLLNFDVQWDERRKDEIGELGETLNFLTEKLKKTIGALQQELQKEKGLEKMRRQFVARVSHELQTPIAIIRGYAEALQDNVASSEGERREYFQIIDEEINKLSNLVKDLLDLGQLESGNFKVQLEHLDLTALIHRTLAKFDLIEGENKFQFKIKGVDNQYSVVGDEYRIEQVLTNLLQNAIKNSLKGEQIKINLKEKEGRIKVEIDNQGRPIEEKDLPHIWESFYKAKEEKAGTGLGLAIVKNVLDLHKSNYGVKNIEGGVRFYFDLEKI